MTRIFLKIDNCFIILLILTFNFTGLLFAQQKNLFLVDRIVTGNAQKFGEKNSVEFRVLENNQELYKVNIELDYDMPFPDLKIFSDGSSVLINSFEATLTFFDNEGSKILISNILKENNVEYERSVYSTISDKIIAISLSQPELDQSIIQFYNNKGQIIHSWQIQEKYINGLSYSNKADLLAVSVYDWQEDYLQKTTVFLKSDGLEISRIPYNFTKGRFVESENIFIGYTNDNCYVFNIGINKLIFNRVAVNDKIILIAEYFDKEIILVQTEKPVLEKGKWYYSHPLFGFLDLNGKTIKLSELNIQSFSKYELLTDKSKLIFKTNRGLFNLK